MLKIIQKIFSLINVLIFFCGAFPVYAAFNDGDELLINDKLYRVEGVLGSGGVKKVFLVKEINCLQLPCEMVMALDDSVNIVKDHYEIELYDKINKISSPHIRREYKFQTAKIKDAPGETQVTIMEYGLGDMSGKLKQLSPQAVRLLYEDVLNGAEALSKNGIINSDIKPGNFMIMGPALTEENILSGKTYLTIADQDFLYSSGIDLQKAKSFIYTPVFSTPEFHQKAVIDGKSALWQIASSFYYELAGELTFEKSDFERFILKTNHPELRLKTYKDRMKEITAKLDQLIKKYQGADKDAMKELKKMILNGLQWDPKDREFWPGEKSIWPFKLKKRRNEIIVDKDHRIHSTMMGRSVGAKEVPYEEKLKFYQSLRNWRCSKDTTNQKIFDTDNELKQIH